MPYKSFRVTFPIILQERSGASDSILLHPWRFRVLLGTQDTAYEVAIPARSQCPPWVSLRLSDLSASLSSEIYAFLFGLLSVIFWYAGMLRHLDWLLNMLIQLRYYSLALQLLSDLLSQVLICLLSGCGWSLEFLRPLRHTVVITFLGAHQTSSRYMEGEPMNLLTDAKSSQTQLLSVACHNSYGFIFLCSSDFHDYHHRLLYTKSGNYSSTFMYMDR